MGSIVNLCRSSREAAAWGEPGAQAPGTLLSYVKPRSGGTARLMWQWQWWALAPLALACAAMATPYLLTHSGLIGVVFERGFALVCHQRPERSWWIFGGSVAVCARCLGVYLGAAIGLLLRTSRTIALRLLMAAAAINVLDAASELAGLHGNWLGMRFALGLALGASGGLLISSTVAEDSGRSVPPLLHPAEHKSCARRGPRLRGSD
jgi:uncharacterized membrane protein